jgi:hypothetical protein
MPWAQGYPYCLSPRWSFENSPGNPTFLPTDATHLEKTRERTYDRTNKHSSGANATDKRE